MAPIIIYGMEVSCSVRSVLMTAHHLGIKYELKVINLLNKEHLKPEFLKMNPQHTTPTIDDNGFILWDSQAICAYLVDKYGKDDALYPKDLEKRALVNQRLHFNTGILFPREQRILRPIFHLLTREITKEHRDEMIEGYEFLEKFLINCNWLAGEQATIADLCCITTINTIYSAIPVDPVKYPNITRWIENCKKLPCYQVNLPGEEQLLTRIQKQMQQN